MILRAAIALLGMMACGSVLAQEASVNGTATYRERMALPKDAIFEILLEDISRADAPAVVLGRFESGPALQQVPIPFSVPYNPSQVNPAGRYGLRARISVDGRPLFVTDRHVPALTQGAPQRHALVLRRFAGPPGPPPAPRQAMRGMYRYMADAGQFADCATGKRYPVAPEMDVAALEVAYTRAPHAPGADLLVEFDGRIAERPRRDGGGSEPTVIVDRHKAVRPGETCGAIGASVALADTYWRLTRLGDRPVETRPGQRELHLVLRQAEARATGFGGCNQFTGPYRVAGASIALGPMAATMMACLGGMEVERAYFDALGGASAWRIAGEHLELRDGSGRMLARFEARALP